MKNEENPLKKTKYKSSIDIYQNHEQKTKTKKSQKIVL